MVITGARLWTGTDDLTGPVPEVSRDGAVALRNGRILAVGDSDDIQDLAGPGTERLHLPGRLVLPSFQDAHVHPPFAGRYRMHVSLHDLADVPAYLQAIATYAAEHPDLPWIYGAGWAPESFPDTAPVRELLDAIVPDRPVFLFDSSVHSAWVNSRALQVAGVNVDTPNPADGRLRRDPATGEPIGILDEGAAYSFEARYLPAPDRAEWRSAILLSQAHLLSLGITGWQDAWVTPDILEAYGSLADDGLLTARVVAALWWQRERGLEQIADFRAQRESGARSDRLLVRTVKIMTDGVVENGTGALLTSYHDGCGGHTGDLGLSYLDPELLAAAVTELDRLDFQVHLHTIGDRAVRDGLDAVGAALRVNGQRGNRHHLAHIQVIQPEDVGRFATVGAVANCQAYWAQSEPMMDELTIPVLGAERSRMQYPFADLVTAGTVLAMGSDWAVSTADPLQQIEVAVTRVDPQRRTNSPFLPDQRLTLGTALRGFTAGSAWVNHDPDGGTIRAGKRADLAILDRDIFEPPSTGTGIGDA
ncbi:amidohydrolase, partial [Jatrophihabitans sp.]|uniref:amidohydrolase n=1 Tax=Jatrophihabitans sp. TaxID=1932789 RepID=UPI002C66B4E1|nr:amidohydrolase [Jatrophihabitans sp.]